MNIFSLHGKWYQNDENRLTSNVLFFLHQFKKILLPSFLNLFLSEEEIGSQCEEIENCQITFQAYDSGIIPDAEIVIGNDTRILIEAKIGSNLIDTSQIKEYSLRLKESEEKCPNYYLFVITQTDQRNRVEQIGAELEKEGIIKSKKIINVKWEKILEMFENRKHKNSALKMLMDMFLKEVQSTMYSRTDIELLQLKNLNEIVLTTQNKKFVEMAIEDCVFWPYARFNPSQYVGYYFLKECPEYGGTIPYIAKIKHIWYDVTIDEVLTSIPEFKELHNFERFKNRALEVYSPGSSTQFTIGITETPIKLKKPIYYEKNKVKKMHPNILPGQTTTFEKLLRAETLEDLY